MSEPEGALLAEQANQSLRGTLPGQNKQERGARCINFLFVFCSRRPERRQLRWDQSRRRRNIVGNIAKTLENNVVPVFCSDWLGCPFAGRCLASLTHTPSRDEPAKYWPRLSHCEHSGRQLPNTDPALQTETPNLKHTKIFFFLFLWRLCILLFTVQTTTPVFACHALLCLDSVLIDYV